MRSAYTSGALPMKAAKAGAPGLTRRQKLSHSPAKPCGVEAVTPISNLFIMGSISVGAGTTV